jgi:hypothetical protein
MFDEDMTDIGEDSDGESNGKNSEDYYKHAYNGKDARLYHQLEAERDERKPQLRVERRARKVTARTANAVAGWNTAGQGEESR